MPPPGQPVHVYVCACVSAQPAAGSPGAIPTLPRWHQTPQKREIQTALGLARSLPEHFPRSRAAEAAFALKAASR